MHTYTVHALIGTATLSREVTARDALSACKSAAKSGGFTARDIRNAMTETRDGAAILSIRDGVLYSTSGA